MSGNGPWTTNADGEMVLREKADDSLRNPGQGVNRQLPHLGDPGQGVNRQLPHLGNPGQGECAKRRAWLVQYLRGFADRLRNVRVCCGDWSRVCGPSVTFRHGVTGVLLDPPYSNDADRTDGLYAKDCGQVAHAAREWAVAQGKNPDMRIVLCGYDGEHDMPAGWRVHEWKATGGYGLEGTEESSNGRANSRRERLWFSPSCLVTQPGLFDALDKQASVEGVEPRL